MFNKDNTLAELKGFEMKRRGELKIIKVFQSQLFENFLLGKTLRECYAAVSRVADRWMSILFSRGEGMDSDELLELISCSSNMSKAIGDYGSQKRYGVSP